MSDIDYRSKIAAFYQRLSDKTEKITKLKKVPKSLISAISFPNYLSIFNRLISDNALKTSIEKQLKLGKPVRIAKELNYFVRTLNIVFEPENNDICLMLETKTKSKSNKRNTKTPILMGRQKKVKPAWRIDTPTPEKYANAVLYGNSSKNETEKMNLELALQKATLPIKLSARFLKYEHGFHLATIGASFEKQGLQHITQKPYTQKISLYSKWANQADLDSFLKNPKIKKMLTVEECDILAIQLLFTVFLMHDQNIIHQDIKTLNILTFKRDDFFFLELSDFGMSVAESSSNSSIATATAHFESPEIYSANFCFKDKKEFNYSYYFKSKGYSHGRQVFLENKSFYLEEMRENSDAFIKPSKANDVWALGIVLTDLYKETLSTPKGIHRNANLISKLLHLDREKRISAKDAFFQLFQEMKTTKPYRYLFEHMELAAQQRKIALFINNEEQQKSSQELETYTDYVPTFKMMKTEASPFLLSSPSLGQYFNQDYFKAQV